MLFAAFMVSADVLSRRLLGLTMGGSDEISGYLFAISTALAMPYALLHRANVRIDALYMHLPARLRAILDLFGIGLLAIFAGAVTWRAALSLSVTWVNGSRAITPLQTPLIVPQSMWFAGWLLFCLCLALVLYGMITATLRGDLARVQKLGGALSVEEEIEEEAPGVTSHHSDRGFLADPSEKLKEV
jgi:TRAP-type C4-dicarboxylate transport system permease small subunit